MADHSVHEGQNLRALLKRRKITQSKLASALGYRPPAAQRWLKEEAWSPQMWRSIREALLKVGVNPQELRPEPPAASSICMRPAQDVVERVQQAQRKLVRQLLTVLEPFPELAGAKAALLDAQRSLERALYQVQIELLQKP